MDESMTCECGSITFWWLGKFFRCRNCYNEYKFSSDGIPEYWMRRFNNEGNGYPENWEHFNPETKIERITREGEEVLKSDQERIPIEVVDKMLEDSDKEPYGMFKNELTSLINKYSLENGSNTPDFILSEYLLNCLKAYEEAITHNARWRTKEKKKRNQ